MPLRLTGERPDRQKLVVTTPHSAQRPRNAEFWRGEGEKHPLFRLLLVLLSYRIFSPFRTRFNACAFLRLTPPRSLLLLPAACPLLGDCPKRASRDIVARLTSEIYKANPS